MKKIIYVFAVICLTAMSAIGCISCTQNAAPVVLISKRTNATFRGTVNGQQDTIKIKLDGTWDETWSGDGKVYTAGVYTVLSGDDNNGIVNITVTSSLLTAVPVGTTTNIIITNGQFTYNGNNYTKR